MDELSSDAFKSRIMYQTAFPNGNIPVDGFVHDNFVSEDEVDFQPADYGWDNGGLQRILMSYLKSGSINATQMYFRGSALFGNINDAKNDYLMDPWPSTIADDVVAHIPFGMVIPTWTGTSVTAVTVVLWWQELNYGE